MLLGVRGDFGTCSVEDIDEDDTEKPARLSSNAHGDASGEGRLASAPSSSAYSAGSEIKCFRCCDNADASSAFESPSAPLVMSTATNEGLMRWPSSHSCDLDLIKG